MQVCYGTKEAALGAGKRARGVWAAFEQGCAPALRGWRKWVMANAARYVPHVLRYVSLPRDVLRG